MMRPWNVPAPPARPSCRTTPAAIAVLVALAVNASAMLAPLLALAQAGLEAGMLSQNPVRTMGEYRAQFGPEWAPSHDPALQSQPRQIGAQRRYGGRGGAQAVPTRPVRPPSGAPGKIAGLVYDRETRVPLGFVTVILSSTEPEFVITTLSARTDSAGYYEFAAVEPGRWSLGIPHEGLTIHPAYAPPRAPQVITLDRKQVWAAAPLALGLKTCVEGHTAWSDGYTLFDAPLTIVPYDSTLAIAGGRVNGIGDYSVCDAADDSVMVWMHLRDGRSLGRTIRLAPGTRSRIDFTPEPLDRMAGALLRVHPVLADGTPVPLALVTIVGRRFEQGDRPALVFVREQRSDREGEVEFRAPPGTYEVLAINPRQGQSGSERIVIDLDRAGGQPLRILLRGTSPAGEQAALRRGLLERAETSLYVWGQ